MVCKRSLYCWKNGPCASDQTRKQIWEDNIRFRESLRDINQSDHYWSFQISKNRCLCLESEEAFWDRPLSRKYRSASLQRLHDIDCTSVTHDFNGLKFRNCYVHNPIHNSTKTTEIKRVDTPIPQSLTKREPLASVKCIPNKHKSDEKSEFCHRYKNTLTALKPHMKTRFLSQTNLTADDTNMKKKSFHNSCENLSTVKKQSDEKTSLSEPPKNAEVQLKQHNYVKSKTDTEVQTDVVSKKLKPIKVHKENSFHNYAPISRTTRRMVHGNKQIPFVTYGCNNSNLDIGSKRTHNVLASKLEVYPNALTAKQQKHDMIMKYIQSEKEFQKKCLPEELRRKVNHSSLWSLDTAKDKLMQKKSSKYLLPLMSKPAKRVSSLPSQFDSSYYRSYQKPQVYFY